MSVCMCLCAFVSVNYLKKLLADFDEIYCIAGSWPEEKLIRFW